MILDVIYVILMKIALSITILILLLSATSVVESAEVSCYRCHANDVEHFKNSIHDKRSITCADCHGGNESYSTGTFVMNSGNFVGVPDSLELPTFCGKCHAREQADYDKSTHWQLLKEGRTDAAKCTDCHGAHDAKASNNPESLTYREKIPILCASCHANKEMTSAWYYGIKTDPFDTYKESYHWKALEKGYVVVAVCSDCHENHKPTRASDPKSSVNPANLPKTCEKEGCHERGTFDVKVAIGFVHDRESMHTPELMFDKSMLTEKAKAYYLGPFDLAYYIGIFFKIITYVVIGALVGLVILDMISRGIRKIIKR